MQKVRHLDHTDMLRANKEALQSCAPDCCACKFAIVRAAQ